MFAQPLQAQFALWKSMPIIQTCASAAGASRKQQLPETLQGQAFFTFASLLCIKSAFDFQPGLSAGLYTSPVTQQGSVWGSRT